MKRVFVFSNQSLSSQGIECLLGDEPGLDILGWETDLEESIRRIRQIQPHVVILAGDDTLADCPPTVKRILEACQGIRVVEVNLETCTLRIYAQEQRLVREVQDLMDVIKDAAAVRQPQLGVDDQAASGSPHRRITQIKFARLEGSLKE